MTTAGRPRRCDMAQVGAREPPGHREAPGWRLMAPGSAIAPSRVPEARRRFSPGLSPGRAAPAPAILRGCSSWASAEDLEALLGRATELAVAWGSGAAASTTIGQERAILRLFGVSAGSTARAGRWRPRSSTATSAPTRGASAAGSRCRSRWPSRSTTSRRRSSRSRSPRATSTSGSRRSCSRSPTGARSRRPTPRRWRGRRWTGWTRTGRRAASCWRCSATRLARGSGPGLGSAAIVDALDEARAAIDAGAELVRVDVPPSRELAERTARPRAPRGALARTAVVARRPGHVRPVRAADPDRRPARARRPAPVRRRGGRAPSRLRPDHDRRPGAGRAGPGGRRRLRADRHRHRGPDARDRRRPGRPGPGDRRPRVRAPAPGARRHAGARPGRAADRRQRPRRRACRPIPATRAGRALALQLLAVALARRDGLGVDVGRRRRVPRLADRGVRGAGAGRRGDRPPSGAAARAPARVRRAGPPAGPRPAVARDRRGAARRRGRRAGRRPPSRRDRRPRPPTRGRRPASPRPARVARRAASCGAARSTTRRGRSRRRRRRCAALEDGGWTSLVDAPLAFAAGRLGADAVAERTEAFDPLAVVPTGRRSALGRGASGRPARRRRPAARTSGSATAPRAASRTRRGAAARPGPPRRTPQSASRWSAPASSRPSAVSAYSIRTGLREYGVATRIPARSRRRSRSERMLGAIPRDRLAELVEPARARQERLDDQQAPAVADAVERDPEGARGVAGALGRRGVGSFVVVIGANGRGGLADARWSVVDCKSQVTTSTPISVARNHRSCPCSTSSRRPSPPSPPPSARPSSGSAPASAAPASSSPTAAS